MVIAYVFVFNNIPAEKEKFCRKRQNLNYSQQIFGLEGPPKLKVPYGNVIHPNVLLAPLRAQTFCIQIIRVSSWRFQGEMI